MVRALPCGDYISFQVLLDRQGFSSGQIDGRPGNNFTHALSDLLGAWLYDHLHLTFRDLVWLNAGTTILVLVAVPFLPA